jgi:hypothetical protein
MLRFIYILLVFISVAGTAQEQLFIQTDKPGYHAGETIWFRIDVIPAGSAIAYIELLDSANAPVMQDKIKLNNAFGAGSLTIPANLPAGNYLLRGYTNLMKNYGAESFFTKQIGIVNLLQSPKSVSLITTVNAFDKDINTDKPSYKSREKVTVNLPSLKNASVSVYRLDSFQIVNNTSTQSRPVLKTGMYAQETKGNALTGKVINIKTGKPVPDASCYLSVVGPVNMFYASTSDSAGNVLFEVNNVYDDNQLVVQAVDSNYRVDINDGFFKEYAVVKKFAAGNYTNDVDEAVSAQVQLIYNRNKDSVNAPVMDTLPFYGYAEYNYLVDEYVKFSSIEDIFREYIRPVQIIRRGGALVPVIFLDKERRLMNNSPFVLVDNVPVLNIQQLMRINPVKLQRIDVVDRPYWYKQQYYEGIISVFTKNRDPEDYLNRHATIQHFKGLQLTRNFYSPLYDTETKRNNRLPDFRNVLYWSPNAQGGNIVFYTSDLPGDYIINVQSTGENGELFSRTARFKVE